MIRQHQNQTWPKKDIAKRVIRHTVLNKQTTLDFSNDLRGTFEHSETLEDF